MTHRENEIGCAKNMQYKQTCKIPLIHVMTITQIIALSDYKSRI